MQQLNWPELDILIVNGDAYVDHPSFGAALIARVLEAQGWRVGIISQPDWSNPDCLKTMGTPRLFCAISAGNLDSMLAHYSATRNKRKTDSYSPGGKVGLRPNLATIVYSQLAKRSFPNLPIILGGLEASMRRVSHYDYWQDRVRPSVICDSRADLLLYGMAEKAIVEATNRIYNNQDLNGIAGSARFLGANESKSKKYTKDAILPSHQECLNDPKAILELTKLIEREQNPFAGKTLIQFNQDRLVVVEPPALPISTEEFDQIYDFPFMRLPHPSYREKIPAFEMIKDSITVVRGCGGGCSFCGLGLHQGRFLSSRSTKSVVDEVSRLTEFKSFRGTITDLGGPTANLYGCQNGQGEACKNCKRVSCLHPNICSHLNHDPEPAIALMKKVKTLPKVKHVFIQSGIRMDLAVKHPNYIRQLVQNHVSGHLKVAPEHLAPEVLKRMRKPGPAVFKRFRELFNQENKLAKKEQYLVPYFISNFPGCNMEQANVVSAFLKKERWQLQQVQDYIPLPMTAAAAMYYSGLDYETSKPIEVMRGLAQRRTQSKQLSKRRNPSKKS